MKKYKEYWIWRWIFIVVFAAIYLVGITFNPNFNIHDFCMGLATEIIGLVITVVIIDKYVTLRIARREDLRAVKAEKNAHKNGTGEKPQ